MFGAERIYLMNNCGSASCSRHGAGAARCYALARNSLTFLPNGKNMGF
jgi:hypothetical protein